MSDKPESEFDQKGKGSLSKAALGGVSVMGITVGAQMTLQLLSMAILARLLTPFEFGVIAAANIVITFSNMFSDIALGSAIIQIKNITEQHIRVALTLSVLSSVVVAGALFIFAPFLSEYFEIPEIHDVLVALSVVFLWTGLSTVAENLMSRSFRYKELGVIKICGSLLAFVVAVAMASLGFSYWSVVTAIILQSFFGMVCMLLMQRHSLLPSFDFQSLKDLIYIGGGLSFSRIVNYVALNVDNFFIAKMIGTESLGFYDRAYRLSGFPTMIFDRVASKVALSSYSRAQDDMERMNFAFRRGLSLTALLGLPVTFILVILGPEIILFVLGDQWKAAIIPFMLLVAGMFFRLSYKVSQSVIIALGKVYHLAVMQMVYALFVAYACYTAYPYGINAIACAVTSAVSMNFVMLSIMASKFTGVNFQSFIKTCLNGALITLLVVILIVPYLYFIRPYAGAFVTLLGAGAILVALVFYLILKPDPRLWGDHGLWLRNEVMGVLEKKLPHVMKKF